MIKNAIAETSKINDNFDFEFEFAESFGKLICNITHADVGPIKFNNTSLMCMENKTISLLKCGSKNI